MLRALSPGQRVSVVICAAAPKTSRLDVDAGASAEPSARDPACDECESVGGIGMTRTTLIAALVALALAVPAAGRGAGSAWKLKIGDPARRDREAPIVLDGITDTAAGKTLTTGELAAKLDDVRVLFVGESHTDIAFHRVQLQVIRELQKRGREVLIGLEMYPYTEQASLDLWNSGTASEDDFVVEVAAGTRTGATTGTTTATSSCSRARTASRCTASTRRARWCRRSARRASRT